MQQTYNTDWLRIFPRATCTQQFIVLSIGGCMKQFVATMIVAIMIAGTASAQMVPFTPSGTSAVTPFASLALKDNAKSEYALGAMYMASFGLGVQADYSMGNGGSDGLSSSTSDVSLSVGYFPVWAGSTGGFNLGVVAGYSAGRFDDDNGDLVKNDRDFSLALSTSYTGVVSERVSVIPFFTLGWALEEESNDVVSNWDRGSYNAYGTHIRYGMGSNALVFTVQSSGASWERLALGVRYVIAL